MYVYRRCGMTEKLSKNAPKKGNRTEKRLTVAIPREASDDWQPSLANRVRCPPWPRVLAIRQLPTRTLRVDLARRDLHGWRAHLADIPGTILLSRLCKAKRLTDVAIRTVTVLLLGSKSDCEVWDCTAARFRQLELASLLLVRPPQLIRRRESAELLKASEDGAIMEVCSNLRTSLASALLKVFQSERTFVLRNPYAGHPMGASGAGQW